MEHHSENVVKSSEVLGVDVINPAKENLGRIEEIMLDKYAGKVAYVVLESGSFLGLGGKYFAIPWHALHYDRNQQAFVLDIDKNKLQNAPGFDKNHWPDMADRSWGSNVHQYYDTKSYWE